MTTQAKPFLVSLLPSIDCDLARWLLQHYGIDYVEHPHAPVFHVLALKWYGVGKEQYPLLVDGASKYPGVPPLFNHYEAAAPAEKQLLPQDPDLRKQVEEIVEYFRNTMGNGVVKWAYFHFLPHKWLNWNAFTTGVPWFERLTVALAYSGIKYLMMKGLDLSPEVAAQGLEKVLAGFDKADALLADGRKFLFADRLTYADLAFAAMAAPMVLADGYGGHLPTIDKVPEDMKKVMVALRARPAGAFIQRIYDEYRKRPGSKPHAL